MFLALAPPFQISCPWTLTHDGSVAGGRPPKKQRYKPQLTAASYRYFLRGQSDKAAAADFKVAKQKRIQLKPYDKLLKSFQYREALDAAVATGRPEIISSLVEELATRSGLPAALGGWAPAAILFSESTMRCLLQEFELCKCVCMCVTCRLISVWQQAANIKQKSLSAVLAHGP